MLLLSIGDINFIKNKKIKLKSLCYCDRAFVAEERASKKDDVGKAQESYVLL